MIVLLHSSTKNHTKILQVKRGGSFPGRSISSVGRFRKVCLPDSLASNSADESKDGHFAIADKSVSRQHLTIEVGVPGPDDCVSVGQVRSEIHTNYFVKRNPKSRSIVILNDQKTKAGTTVNGEQIKGIEDYELKSEINEIIIGRSKHIFR